MSDRQAERAPGQVPARADGDRHGPATPADHERAPGTSGDEQGPRPRSARTVAGAVLFVLLSVLALVLAAVVGFSWWGHAHPAAGHGAVSSTSARDGGLPAARRLTERVLSYGWKTLDDDAAAVTAVSTPDFEKQYAATMAKVRAQTVRHRLRLRATAVATSVVSARRDQVVALVFVNQETLAPGPAGGRRDQKRVLVTLARDGGEWRVSAMDTF